MFTVEYWNDRAQKYGHTGHAEPFYYCFDQQARLYAVDRILSDLPLKKESALDFGCGSGDFTELLANYYTTICGYDVSETVIRINKQKFQRKNITFIHELGIPITEKSYDLILTVTVLQTLSKISLEQTLQLFSQLLSQEGVIVSMEFFATEQYNSENHETRVTETEWLTLLAKNNLKITSTIGFYNPIALPTKSWLKYKNSFISRFLKIFKYNPLVQKHFRNVSKKLIQHHGDVLNQNESPYKIWIIQKAY